MKRLYLLRHAESDYSNTLDDIKRPLNKIGINNSSLIGKYFNANNILPEYILSSNSVRTSQTIKNILKETSIKTKIDFKEKLYLATAGEIIKIIAQTDDKINSVLIVAHNPGIDLLVKFILKRNQIIGLLNKYDVYPPCGFIELSTQLSYWHEIDPESFNLESFICPEELKKPL